jgi:CheY-like chemotaxis protein
MAAVPTPAPPDAPSRRDREQPRVLLIDPDQASRAALVAALVDGGAEVVAALRTGVTAVYAVRQHRPTVIVIDLDLRPAGIWGGLTLVASLAKEAPAVPILAAVRPELEELSTRARRAGARRLLPKLDVNAVVTAVFDEHARHPG